MNPLAKQTINAFLFSLATLASAQTAMYLKNDSSRNWHFTSVDAHYTVAIERNGLRRMLAMEANLPKGGKDGAFTLKPGDIAKVDCHDAKRPVHFLTLLVSDSLEHNPFAVYVRSEYVTVPGPGGGKLFSRNSLSSFKPGPPTVAMALNQCFLQEGDTFFITADSYAPVLEALAAQAGAASAAPTGFHAPQPNLGRGPVPHGLPRPLPIQNLGLAPASAARAASGPLLPMPLAPSASGLALGTVPPQPRNQSGQPAPRSQGQARPSPSGWQAAPTSARPVCLPLSIRNASAQGRTLIIDLKEQALAVRVENVEGGRVVPVTPTATTAESSVYYIPGGAAFRLAPLDSSRAFGFKFSFAGEGPTNFWNKARLRWGFPGTLLGPEAKPFLMLEGSGNGAGPEEMPAVRKDSNLALTLLPGPGEGLPAGN
jgi:hypothetical protein